MDYMVIGPDAGISYEYDAPSTTGKTFIFVNAITGSTAVWQAEIGPRLRAVGYGTLAYNMRGQEASPFSKEDELNETLIVSDLKRLLAHVDPPQPILVGLSIGGLFAGKAILSGVPARGLVLVNMLRKPGLPLDWIGEAMTRAAKMGGQQFLMDLYLPMLVGPRKLSELRANCLGEEDYVPFKPEDGLMQLLANARLADWDIAYESLALPVLVLTGLKDRVFYNPEDVSELLVRLPNAKAVEFPELGHLIPVEDGSATADHLLAFADTL